jgi:hypothetical protein
MFVSLLSEHSLHRHMALKGALPSTPLQQTHRPISRNRYTSPSTQCTPPSSQRAPGGPYSRYPRRYGMPWWEYHCSLPRNSLQSSSTALACTMQHNQVPFQQQSSEQLRGRGPLEMGMQMAGNRSGACGCGCGTSVPPCTSMQHQYREGIRSLARLPPAIVGIQCYVSTSAPTQATNTPLTTAECFRGTSTVLAANLPDTPALLQCLTIWRCNLCASPGCTVQALIPTREINQGEFNANT